MHDPCERARISAILGIAVSAVMKAAERTDQLKLFDQGQQLTYIASDLCRHRRELLELAPQTPHQEQLPDVPF